MDREPPRATEHGHLFVLAGRRAIRPSGPAEEAHREDLEEEATHITDEARMILTGVALSCAVAVLLALAALWFGVPFLARMSRR